MCKVENYKKIYVYFVTSVFSFISNIVSTNLLHGNENKLKSYRNKRVRHFLCFDIHLFIR